MLAQLNYDFGKIYPWLAQKVCTSGRGDGGVHIDIGEDVVAVLEEEMKEAVA